MGDLEQLLERRKAVLAELADLDAAARAAAAQQKVEAVKEVLKLMTEKGLTVADLAPAKLRRVVKDKRVGKVAPKFLNPKTGETWTGRGRLPLWLQAEVDAGKRPQDFLIKG